MADYFVQQRLNKGKPQEEQYVPSEEEMKHVRDVFMLLEAVTGDAFFAPYKKNEKQFRGVKSMKGYLDCVKQQGIKQGRIIVYVELVQDKMASTNCSVKEAMDQVGVKKGYRAAVLKQLKASKSA